MIYQDGIYSESYIKKQINNTTQERELAFYLLYSVFEHKGFSNLVLKDTGVNKTSDFVTALFYGTITMSYSIDFLVKHASNKKIELMDPATRTLVRMGAWQILFSDKVPEFAAVKTTVDIARKLNLRSYSFINAILHRICELDSARRTLSSYRPEIATSMKPEIFGILKKSYGKDKAISIGTSMLSRPRIAIRTNTNKITCDELRDLLVSGGLNVEESSFMPDSLYIDGTNIGELKEFADGLFMVQNEAAQLISYVANPSAGDEILDCCAAPGGKTTHLAQIAPSSKITAIDINSSRLELIKQNADRLGLDGIDLIVGDSTDLDLVLNDKEFDLVLCDVPCSGLGLMGRKPDIRQTITFDRINELIPIQKSILDSASKHVRVGGKIIYSTCTMNRSENEDRIFDFLGAHSEYKTVDITSLLPNRLHMDADRLEEAREGHITLFPDSDKCDGFFMCMMERIK